ncbi:hypothetical protein GQX73_g10739 [Xylaria multiplex]|uniref:Uncharacterized protein n=1 Tax=Xylaria multiplex TaxID=323545 RepID=A0A7C8MM47_9PEZI|nr:hypothetical protein GQX73_g10739 [Xylaria multiplex]
MELTPIRVRGKRRAPGEELITALPLKRARKDLGQKKRAEVRRSKASNIERSMPLEVLERIFWLSENANFPRASLRLGRLLSGSSTLRETFLTAFGPTWDVWFGCVHGQAADFPVIQSYAGWEEDTERFGGNPSFQSNLLACSWTTIDLILNCWDTWVRRHARKRLFEYIPLWGDPSRPNAYLGSSAAVRTGDIEEAGHYFFQDYHAFRTVERLSSYSEGLKYRTERNLSTWIEVHRSTEIPDDLVTGPWSESSLQKLFWLVRAGARLSPSQTWEITREGFRNAMSDRYIPNLSAIRLLHILGAFRDWPKHVRNEEFHRIDSVMPVLHRDNDSALHAKYTYVESLLIMNVE